MKKVMLCAFLYFLLSAAPAWSSDIVSVTSDLVRLLRSGQQLITVPVVVPRPINYWTIAQKAGHSYRVDPRLILSIIKHESDFNPNAVSVKGAQGLMQLMPETAESLGVINSFDPTQNISGGTRYLQQMIQRFHGDIYVALLAYNAGLPELHADQYRQNRIDMQQQF